MKTETFDLAKVDYPLQQTLREELADINGSDRWVEFLPKEN